MALQALHEADRSRARRDSLRRLGRGAGAEGYQFPPANAGDPAFVDGWDVHFTRLLTTVDNITLSNGPDVSPGDQSLHGARRRQGDRPLGGRPGAQRSELPAGQGRPGRGGGADRGALTPELPAGEQRRLRHQRRESLRLRLRRRSRDDERDERQPGHGRAWPTTRRWRRKGARCSTSARRRSKGRRPAAPARRQLRRRHPAIPPSTVRASGRSRATSCRSASASSRRPRTSTARTPTTIRRWRSRARSMSAGSSSRPTRSVVGQVTIHTDHPFWDSVLHDSPAHFDQFAARVAGMGRRRRRAGRT